MIYLISKQASEGGAQKNKGRERQGPDAIGPPGPELIHFGLP